jgi:serine/threonine-protein kinase
MELVEGQSLSRKLKTGPLPEREAAQLVQTLAQAVHYAHQHHVIHRDLKPANVLIASTGTVKLMDFGLAKLLDAESGHTKGEVILGTANYMAPEQARGDVKAVGPLADVYGLGAILYETLTGRPPFRADTQVVTLLQVQLQPPLPPSHHRPKLSRCLEAICLKCLEKDPGRRYPSAAALADDLGRWLEGKATVARPRTWLVKSWQFVRSHSRWSVAVVLLTLLGVGLVLRNHYRDPERPRKRADATLRSGEPYVFDDPSQLPGPFRWVIGDHVPLKPNVDDGCVSVRTLSTGLLELVADPQCERYLFSVELRHDDAPGHSHVGLYFGSRQHQTAEGNRQWGFYSLSFADRGELAEAFGGRGSNATSQVRFRCWFFEQRPNNPCPGGPVGKPRRFRPALPVGKPGPWRELAVKVTPEGVETFWRNDRGELERFGNVTTKDLERCLMNVKRLNPDMAGVPTAFHPRAGLGLFVYRGEVAFRRIMVKPLPASGNELGR